MKLQKKILLFTILITFISIITMGVIAHNLITINMENTLGRQALDLANFVSNLDIVKSAYTLNNPTLVLQPFTESLHSRNLASFVVFMDMEGTRYTHPNKDLIGLKFTGGDEVEALKGRSYISKAVGISGPSIRGFSPIFIDGVQVGAVSVGMFQENVDSLLETNRNALLYTMLMSIIIAIPSAFALSYNIKRTIFGLEPVDIAMLLTQREIMINSVKEGIIFTNKEDKIELINDRACEMLGLRKDDVGKHVKEIIPTSRMDDVRKSGIDEYNEQQKINGVTIITNRMVVKYNENILGVVATFSEKEELQRLAEELTNSKSYASVMYR
jgi:PAS domain S-box-containing protein